jgi:hypothetical protein
VLEMAESVAAYTDKIEGFENPTITSALSAISTLTTPNQKDAALNSIKSFIQTEKNTADTLLNSARRFTTISNKKELSSTAYDAAFESEKAPIIKGPSDTLQGFALLLFFGSFLALLCILPIKVYLVTQDYSKTGIAFGGLFFLGIMFTGFIQRFA